MFGMNIIKMRETERAKKKLEIELENISHELTVQKRTSQFKLEEETHKYKLKMTEDEANFKREKEHWEEDRVELEKQLNKKYEIAKNEMVVMLKLESQQAIKQQELSNEKALLKVEKEYNSKLTEEKKRLNEKFFKNLTDAFTEIQLNGDKNSKFVQELSLKMLDKMPCPKTNKPKVLK
jgi:hypothetical protein